MEGKKKKGPQGRDGLLRGFVSLFSGTVIVKRVEGTLFAFRTYLFICSSAVNTKCL